MKNRSPHREFLAKIFLIIALFSSLSRNSFASFKVHEWGTFTSVQGSNGEVLSGLEHEEEELPSFVHNAESQSSLGQPFSIGSMERCGSDCGFCCKGVCCDGLISRENKKLRITQKMETPVLYFYSSSPLKVDVKVDFPKGLITQFYPAPSAVLPSFGSTQKLENGRIQYSGLEILQDAGQENSLFPKVAKGSVYGPARDTHSNPVRIQTASGEIENEKFVFYRGLGDFKNSLQVTSNSEKISLKDLNGRGISYILALNIQDGKGAFKELGKLSKNETASLNLKAFMNELTPRESLSEFENSAGKKLIRALQESGLYEDEAHAMVNTWKLSYFHTEGLRVLYILPREEADQLLPLSISPQPDEVVRTLVGRVEVLTQPSERELLAQISKAVATGTQVKSKALQGRFKEPKFLRIQALTESASVKKFISQNLANSN